MEVNMLTETEWEEIRYSLVETGFFDFEARPKTLQSVRRVVERMSPDERESLQERISIIFAPAPGKHGEVYPFSGLPRDSGQVRQAMVYLSPEIERRSQGYVQTVVAHEFAHVLLHTFDAPSPPSIEREADERILLWGFKPAYNVKEYRG